MTFTHAGHYGSDSLTTSSGTPVPAGTVIEVLDVNGDPAELFTGRTRVPLGGPAVVDVAGNFSFYAEPGDYDLRVGAGPLVRVSTDVDHRDVGTGGGGGPTGPETVLVGDPVSLGGPAYLWDLTVAPDAELFQLDLTAIPDPTGTGLTVAVRPPQPSTVPQEFDVAIPAVEGDVPLYGLYVLTDAEDPTPAEVALVGPFPTTVGSGLVIRIWGTGIADEWSATVISDEAVDLSGYATAAALADEVAARTTGDAAAAAALTDEATAREAGDAAAAAALTDEATAREAGDAATLAGLVARGRMVAVADGWEDVVVVRLGPPATDAVTEDGGLVFLAGFSRGVDVTAAGVVAVVDEGFRPFRDAVVTELLRSGVYSRVTLHIAALTGEVTVVDVDPAPVGDAPAMNYSRSHWSAGPAA